MRVNRAFIALAFCSALAAPALAQDMRSTPNLRLRIRITQSLRVALSCLPGFPANRNVRITLSNSVSHLSTFYTNKQGEFHLNNLERGNLLCSGRG